MTNVEVFGVAADGSEVQRISIERDGLRACLISQGATLQDLRLAGHNSPLVLGYPSLQPYLKNPNYFGATVGRFANRLKGGVADIAGQPHLMDRNTTEGHHIHGGHDGTATLNWEVAEHSSTHVQFETRLADGHMGFPGSMDVQAIYRILPAQTLEIEITATTTATTLCSFAHHSYFNLDGGRTIDGHRLRVLAGEYLTVEPDGIPTGDIADVINTRFDFRSGRSVEPSNGLDHNFCLSDQRRDLHPAAELTGADGRVTMLVATTEPGLQIYDGQGIGGANAAGLIGTTYGPRSGLAIEPQLWPDAPHNPLFPSAELHPDDVYRQVSQFSFTQPA
ncbi:aldose epimerase family protein [Octadecabacter sp. 1_MG-2023]|uniref:aldose epimerase family protein n=1 Tax=unclassified Octadecabacter TaxID=196158 RepID=UPI001C090BEC|nr:aldose epimerase family protein [Octadecabacter sp. 1_MG-2023]MBU2994615.1 galactose mutarotase [Octadecabacter sp. B2R22]MDO6734092.1 aldose epimerase family protein [Octadecabacter sp. 1_MG-2023]